MFKMEGIEEEYEKEKYRNICPFDSCNKQVQDLQKHLIKTHFIGSPQKSKTRQKNIKTKTLQKESNENLIDEEPNMAVCPFDKCPRYFKQANSLQSHMTKVHFYIKEEEELTNDIENLKPLVNKEPANKDKDTFDCPYSKCNANFPVMHDIHKHMKKFHVEFIETAEYQDYLKEQKDKRTCKSCGKIFVNRTFLNEHVTSKCQEKNHPCYKCTKRFKNENDLKKHTLQSHADLVDCKECGRYFKKASLRNHFIRVH